MTTRSVTRFARGTQAASTRQRALLIGVAAVAGVLAGCAGPNQSAPGEGGKSGTSAHRDPMDAFGELTQRALRSDLDYVRAHLAPSLIVAAIKKDPSSTADDVVRRFQDELQRYSPLDWTPGSTADSGTIHASGLRLGTFAGTPWHFKIDMRFDPAVGWQIASEAYDQKRLGDS